MALDRYGSEAATTSLLAALVAYHVSPLIRWHWRVRCLTQMELIRLINEFGGEVAF